MGIKRESIQHFISYSTLAPFNMPLNCRITMRIVMADVGNPVRSLPGSRRERPGINQDGRDQKSLWSQGRDCTCFLQRESEINNDLGLVRLLTSSSWTRQDAYVPHSRAVEVIIYRIRRSLSNTNGRHTDP